MIAIIFNYGIWFNMFRPLNKKYATRFRIAYASKKTQL